MITQLHAGGQFVGYQGQVQRADSALASIEPYLISAQTLQPDGTYVQILADTVLIPGRAYWIEVSQDCTWTYDKVEISSIDLYAGVNLVVYPGPTRSIEVAVASLLPYVTVVWWYNPIGEWYSWTPDVPPGVNSLFTLVNGEAYRITVAQDCLWVIPEVFPAGAITGYTFWNPDTGDYQASAPTILVGQQAGVKGQFQNTSGAIQRMKMEAVVTDPDSVTTTLPGSWAEGVLDGQVMYWDSDKFTCGKVGTYKVTLILYAELV